MDFHIELRDDPSFTAVNANDSMPSIGVARSRRNKSGRPIQGTGSYQEQQSAQQAALSTLMAKHKQQATAEPEVEKAKCPITREQFIAGGRPMLLVINGENKVASPKDFSTGSFGYHMNEKSVVVIDGVPCKVQWNVIGTVVGSKELPK